MISDPQIASQWKKKMLEVGEVYSVLLKEESVMIGNKTLRFKYFTKGARPQGGYILIFGLHGGGGCRTEVNDKQYENHFTIYNDLLPAGTIWFVPRSCQQAYDMWWKQYLPQFFAIIIKGFVLNEIVNPNKIFMTGYSAGGDGIYHLGPMLADWLAGAAMMAGHPNGVELYNVRNIAFSIQVGGQDSEYNRNQQALNYIRTMQELSSKYGGFNCKYCNVFDDCEHWMNRKDANIFNSFLRQTRNPYPNFITFKQHPRIKKSQFYYIGVVPQSHKELMIVVKRGNVFIIESEQIPVTIYLNRYMVNFLQDVRVWHNGTLTINRKPQKNTDIIVKTIQRLDPEYIFEDCLLSQPIKGRVPLQNSLKQLSLPIQHQSVNEAELNRRVEQHFAIKQSGKSCNLI